MINGFKIIFEIEIFPAKFSDFDVGCFIGNGLLMQKFPQTVFE